MVDISGITEQIAELVEPVLYESGYELVDVEYLSERGNWVLRLYVDKEGGITIEDCASLSREIGPLIDVKDLIRHKYVLEVSSPGLNRPLKKEADFVRVMGKKIKVKMTAPVNGRRNFSGYLKDIREHRLYMEVEGGLIALSMQEIDKASLIYEFQNEQITLE